MIIVSGLVEIAPENREQSIAAVVELARASRLETGCISYAFYEDLEKPNCFRVFEEWKDEESLQKHFRTPHMAAFRDRLVGVEIRMRQIRRYDIESVSEL